MLRAQIADDHESIRKAAERLGSVALRVKLAGR